MVNATDLASDHGLTILDSVVLAAAAEAECRLLLSEDLQEGFTRCTLCWRDCLRTTGELPDVRHSRVWWKPGAGRKRFVGWSRSGCLWQESGMTTTCPGGWPEPRAQTLLEVAADPKHLGAEIGFLSILHTWGQTLQRHPHVHCVVPGAGLSPDRERWIRPPPRFFLPVKVLSRVFRGKFVAGLRRAFRRKKLAFHGDCLPLAGEATFAKLLRTLFPEDWVVYAKRPFGGPEHVLHYLPDTRIGSRSRTTGSSISPTPMSHSVGRTSASQQAADDDIDSRGLLAPFPRTCAPTGLPAHPLLWLSGKSSSRCAPAPLPKSGEQRSRSDDLALSLLPGTYADSRVPNGKADLPRGGPRGTGS